MPRTIEAPLSKRTISMPQQDGSPLSDELRASLLNAIPHLRAFAISLTGKVDQADDLVQEAIMRGLSHLDSFTPGTDLQAWLFTILRNLFYTSLRKRRREVEDPDGMMAGMLSAPPEQHGRLDLNDLRTALGKLSVEQREALLLVGAEGLSYEEAAAICEVNIGTIKSRINRARTRLAELLHVADADNLANRPSKASPSAVTSRRSGKERAPHVIQVQT
jgi:RNA polymerase sigma-70 factor, ECF subfamily